MVNNNGEIPELKFDPFPMSFEQIDSLSNEVTDSFIETQESNPMSDVDKLFLMDPDSPVTELNLYLFNKETSSGRQVDAGEIGKNDNFFLTFQQDGKLRIAASPEMTEELNSLNVLHLKNKEGEVEKTLRIDEVEIHVFSQEEMKALSGFLLASFAAAESRRRLDAEKKEEEKKKLEQEKLAYSRRHEKIKTTIHQEKAPENAPSPSTPVLRPLKLSFKERINETTRREIRKALEKIEEVHHRMIRRIRADYAKYALEKALVKEDEIKGSQELYD